MASSFARRRLNIKVISIMVSLSQTTPNILHSARNTGSYDVLFQTKKAKIGSSFESNDDNHFNSKIEGVKSPLLKKGEGPKSH